MLIGWVLKQKAVLNVYVPNFTPTSSRQQVSKPDSVILRYTPTGHSGRAEEEKSASKPKISTTWRKNQPVKHVKYGIGTIQEIEEKSTGEVHITVRFKASVKKIVAQFLQRL